MADENLTLGADLTPLNGALDSAAKALSDFANGPVADTGARIEIAINRSFNAVANTISRAAVSGKLWINQMVSWILADFARVAISTPRRIFATLAADGSDVNFMLEPVQQEWLCEMAPAALTPVAGGWGRMGATRCDLRAVDERTFLAALEAAHERASAPRTKRRPRR